MREEQLILQIAAILTTWLSFTVTPSNYNFTKHDGIDLRSQQEKARHTPADLCLFIQKYRETLLERKWPY